MRIILTFTLIFFCLVSFEQAIVSTTSEAPVGFNYTRDFKAILEKTKDRNNELYYQKLLIRYLDNDSALTRAEMLALMIGYTEDPHYKPFKDMEKEKEIFDMNDSSAYEEALDESKIYLQTHPLSLRILKERSFSYHQLKKEDSAKYFMDQVEKVMGAMIYSGKGKTSETPIFALGLADGEYFIPNVGMSISSKNTDWNKHNQFEEIIDAMDNNGIHTKYYFVIEHAKQKIDDDEVNDAVVKKPKKIKRKELKHDKPVTDSIPPGN